MAEAVVGVLIGKIGMALAKEAAAYGASLLGKEASAIKDLFGNIRKAERELDSMKAYLHESEKFKDTDETTGIFVKNIRELSFQVEDVVDEFMYKLEGDKHGGFAAKMKKRIKHVKVWHRLAHKLHDINAELEEATKRRKRYAIPGMDTHGEDLVGIEGNAAKLKGCLVDDLEESNTKITTVWGMGGVGKTTLVDHVYKLVKLDFDAAAWVTVSKSYQVEDLLKKIATEFGISVASNMEMIRVVDVIRNHLGISWFLMMFGNGIFVLTSRLYEVASLATSKCTINLEPLEEKYSWNLFCKEAFRLSSDKTCPSELQDLAVKFLQKCEGLPIAISCIGRLLSFKPPTYPEWETVWKELESHSANNAIRSVDTILKVSLEDLPYQLKNCFLHCAMFPEDFEMKRRRLIRHWITSGFINEKENKTLEQVAEGYLSDLVNRSLLQVVRKNGAGRVKCCRMHDVILHLALDKAEKECFGKVSEGHSTVSMLPNEVFSLFNLRFLGLRDTQIESLPAAIGRLQNLEVLDASCSSLVSLPKDVVKLKKLRYLYACVKFTNGDFFHFGGVKMPRGMRNLTGLHALQSVKASTETLYDVAALTELRTFAVEDVKSEHTLSLRSALLNMTNLVSLSITTSNENEVLPLEELRLPVSLSKLALIGQLEKKRMPHILSSRLHLDNLTRLCLIFSKLDENTFPNLMVLHNLYFLALHKAYDGKTLCFSKHSFPRLRELCISSAPQLNQVEIEEDALVSLVTLWISGCPELKRLPRGIQYLAAQEELYLENTTDEFIEMLRQESEANDCKEELMKISHIREVIVESTEKNFWRRIVSNKGK
ncbi:unnamed protein product [Urochloa decumbens]|uniref:Uncharacterized protein n=1 Tax=Urochloa decumbens TaxID=240449 RepID=A0ABC9AYN1_9POAL